MASRFWVGGTGTWDAADTTHWAASSGGAGGQSVPGSSDTVTFDGSSGGGTVTVSHATNTISSMTMGAFTGTIDFSTNNNNISMGTFSGTGTGTRTLSMGNGTWTLTAASGNVWDNSTVTNFTLNQNSSTIDLVATGTGTRTFIGGAKTYNNLSISNAASNANKIRITGNNTFAALTATNVRLLEFAVSSTQTVSGAITHNGTATAPSFIGSDANGGVATLSVASAVTFAWLFVQNITKAGAGSITANNSFDGGGNTSITFTHPTLRPSFALGI